LRKDGAGVPLPKDRVSLLALAADTERLVAQTAIALDQPTAQKHANELLRLGEIRIRLGEPREAEQALDEAATAFWKMVSPFNRERAAFARVMQSVLAMDDGRFEDGLKIIERLVEQFGGFPKFQEVPEGRPLGLGSWMLGLEHIEDYERLYEVAGIALELLDPAGLPKERLEIARTLGKRANAASALGHKDEAVELYEQAIDRFKAEDPAAVGKELINATADLAVLQTELGLEDESVTESLTAFRQMVGTTATTLPKMAISRLFGSRKKQ
jgi:tetratricopeptide (TPR) repeat protein